MYPGGTFRAGQQNPAKEYEHAARQWMGEDGTTRDETIREIGKIGKYPSARKPHSLIFQYIAAVQSQATIIRWQNLKVSLIMSSKAVYSYGYAESETEVAPQPLFNLPVGAVDQICMI